MRAVALPAPSSTAQTAPDVLLSPFLGSQSSSGSMTKACQGAFLQILLMPLKSAGNCRSLKETTDPTPQVQHQYACFN